MNFDQLHLPLRTMALVLLAGGPLCGGEIRVELDSGASYVAEEVTHFGDESKIWLRFRGPSTILLRGIPRDRIRSIGPAPREPAPARRVDRAVHHRRGPATDAQRAQFLLFDPAFANQKGRDVPPRPPLR